MKRLLLLAAAIVTILSGADRSHAQSNPLGLLQQAQAPQAQPASPTPGATAAAPKLPSATFEQLVGDEVVRRDRINPYAIGVGAIAGVVVFNVVTAYLSPGAMMAGGPLAATAVADSAIAASRIYAVTSAVVGALAGNWFAQSYAGR